MPAPRAPCTHSLGLGDPVVALCPCCLRCPCGPGGRTPAARAQLNPAPSPPIPGPPPISAQTGERPHPLPVLGVVSNPAGLACSPFPSGRVRADRHGRCTHEGHRVASWHSDAVWGPDKGVTGKPGPDGVAEVIPERGDAAEAQLLWLLGLQGGGSPVKRGQSLRGQGRACPVLCAPARPKEPECPGFWERTLLKRMPLP